jgi:hypothetical protein
MVLAWLGDHSIISSQHQAGCDIGWLTGIGPDMAYGLFRVAPGPRKSHARFFGGEVA